MFQELYNYLLENNQIINSEIELLDFFDACDALNIFLTDQEMYDFEDMYKVKLYTYI